MRLTVLQKELCIWLVFFLTAAAAGAFYINRTPNDHPGIIRLHVVANSDSADDQALKLAVRDEIIRTMEGQENIEDARQYIDSHLTEIEETAEEVIRKEGFDYGVSAERKVTFIPQKSYEDLTLPAGNYEALKVTLGEGRGQNWWCVIFPQLCLIGEVPEQGMEDDGTVVKTKLILKSKIKEMLKKEQHRSIGQ
ncbi:MAG: stage II sporulation protein R [Emergencia sp.]